MNSFKQPVGINMSKSTCTFNGNSNNNLNTNYNTHNSYQYHKFQNTLSKGVKATESQQILPTSKPYHRTDFSFLGGERQRAESAHKAKSKVESTNIYGTNNINYILKMKELSLNQQAKSRHQSVSLNSAHTKSQPDASSSSSSSASQQQQASAKQTERERFFAEYIKANGDAATQIIPNFLYLGGHRSVNNVQNLIDGNITHVLNMAGELQLDYLEMEKHNIKLLNILARDSKIYNIRHDFDQAFHFIDDCLRSKGKIIINCARGISRSGTIVISYLMFRYSMSLMEAYNFTTSLRPQVKPNSYFRKQLEMYEHELSYNRFKQQMKQKNLSNGSTQSSTISLAAQNRM